MDTVFVTLVILSLLAMVITGIAYWYFLFRPVFSRTGNHIGKYDEIRSSILQITLVVLVVLNLFGVRDSLSAWILPPLSFAFLAIRFIDYFEFLRVPLLIGAVCAAPLFLIWRLTDWCGNRFAWAAATLVFCASTLVSANQLAMHLQDQKIALLEPDCIERHSLFWSLRNAPREFQHEIHLLAYKDGQAYGWSYRDLDFYTLPTAFISKQNRNHDSYCRGLSSNHETGSPSERQQMRKRSAIVDFHG